MKVSLDASSLSKKLLIFGKEEVSEPEVLNVNEEIKEFEEFLKKVVGENIEIVLTLGKNLNNVYIDKIYLQQILLNLTTNAKDAIEENGKIVIETRNIYLDDFYVKKHYGVKKGKYILISFSDNGRGMEKEIIDKIFDPFFTTKGEKGTGLGLSVVYGIIQNVGGYINVYSEKDIGTTFKIYLPVTDKKKKKKEKELESIDFNGYGKKILVVEDEEFLRNIIYEILSKNGYDVELVGDGKEALKKFRKNIYDLVISDMIMPKMNGIILFKEMKKVRENFKILFMSGYTDNILKDEGIDFSNIPFIVKPFRSFELLKKVKEILF